MVEKEKTKTITKAEFQRLEALCKIQQESGQETRSKYLWNDGSMLRKKKLPHNFKSN